MTLADGGFTAPTAGAPYTSTTNGCTTPLTADTNVTLTIEPGVIVYGATGQSWLAVNRGNRINAEGTASQPIVFTSADNVAGFNSDSSIGQWGGVVLLVNLGQLLVATAVMAYYSPPLTVLVVLSFAPLVFILQWFQRRLSVAYDLVRRRVGELMTAIAESVVGANLDRAAQTRLVEDYINRVQTSGQG